MLVSYQQKVKFWSNATIAHASKTDLSQGSVNTPTPGHLPFISSTIRTHLAPRHPNPTDKKRCRLPSPLRISFWNSPYNFWRRRHDRLSK